MIKKTPIKRKTIKKIKPFKFFVYRVIINNVTRYIGYTSDLKKREYTHNYLFNQPKPTKLLYKKAKELNQTYITLIPIRGFKTKVESKRYEMLLILNDHFGNKELYQSIPKITDF